MSGRLAAVIGHPVAHSLSPVMHRAAYAALNLPDWTYTAIEVPSGELASFIATLDPSWAGLSVTMPHKRDIQAFLVGQSDLATQVGAVNTVIVEAGPEVGLRGYNTDVYGIVHAIAEAQGSPHADGVRSLSAAVILGGGATAASAMAAVREHGCWNPVLLMRAPERAAPLLAAAERLGVSPRVAPLDAAAIAAEVGALGSDGALISSLPPTAVDSHVEVLCAAARGEGRQGPILLDVVYDPWPTALAQAWAQSGRRYAGGFAMLVHQAEGQVRLMTGQRPPLAVMRAAGQRELNRRGAVGRD